MPDTFGQYGHYRGASLIDNSKDEIHFSGRKACFACHQDVEDLKTTGVHSEISCETCHGPGQKHNESKKPGDIFKPAGREFCGVCHEKNAGRQKNTVFQVDLSEHNIGKDCIQCHNPHEPWKMKE